MVSLSASKHCWLQWRGWDSYTYFKISFSKPIGFSPLLLYEKHLNIFLWAGVCTFDKNQGQMCYAHFHVAVSYKPLQDLEMHVIQIILAINMYLRRGRPDQGCCNWRGPSVALTLMAQALKGENEVCVGSSCAGRLTSKIWVKILIEDSFLMSPVGRLELTFMQLCFLV